MPIVRRQAAPRVPMRVDGIFRVGLALLFGVLSTACSAQLRRPDPPPPAAPSMVTPAAPAASEEKWKVPPRSPAELESRRSLEVLNRHFGTFYRERRAASREQLGPVILLRLSGASLFREGRLVETRRVIPAAYHDLRYASHLPLSVLLACLGDEGEPLSDAQRDRLKTLRSDVALATGAIGILALTASQKERQSRLLEVTTAFLDAVLTDGTVSREHLERYARLAAPDVESNMRDAGRAQVDGLHAQLLTWRTEIGDAEWRLTRFVVRGGQQPRAGHAAIVYLAAVVQDAGDGRGYVGESPWVVFREDTSAPTETAAAWDAEFDLLSSIALDTELADLMFGDTERLAMDIVADGARARVRELDLSPLARHRAPAH